MRYREFGCRLSIIYGRVIASSIVMTLCFFIVSAEAGKLKKASAYLAKVETSAEQVEKDLDTLKQFIGSVSNIGSFITSDFWGTTPRWYLDGAMQNGEVNITTEYPFTHYWSRTLPRENNVRKIRDISFFPLKTEDWNVRFKLDFSEFLAGEVTYQSGMYTDGEPKKLKRYFLQNGVPEAQIPAALQFHTALYEPMVELLMKGIYTKFNKLYEDVYFSSKNLKFNKELQNIFGDQFNNPAGHEKVIVENGEALRIGSWNNAMTRDVNNAYERLCLEGFERCIYRPGIHPELKITVTNQKFMIARNKSENQKFSQLAQLKTLLEEMIASGKVVKGDDQGKYSTFMDAKLNGKYPGGLAVNLESGMGYWLLPVFQASDELKKLRHEFDTHRKALYHDIEKYLDGALVETVKKFKPQSNNTRDF